MANTNRPLSPHIQVYKWQITMLLSITHRATGIALCAAVPFLMFWIWGLAGSASDYQLVQSFYASFFGRLVLLIFSASLIYHLCNGVRHLYWDIGRGLELPAVYNSGRAVLIATGVLTVLLWTAAYIVAGGGS